jgi:flagellar basal-body rod modification protein FlgD
MNTTGINSLSSSNGNAVMGTRAATMGDNPFLTLLTTQLRNQTPLEPVDNESFMNQMASFTTMQEQRDLNGNLLKLLDFQGVLARVQGLSQGSALLGKEVSYAGEGGVEANGRVESVFVAETGEVRLKLDGDRQIDLRAVLAIRNGSGAGSTPANGTAAGGANANANGNTSNAGAPANTNTAGGAANTSNPANPSNPAGGTAATNAAAAVTNAANAAKSAIGEVGAFGAS